MLERGGKDYARTIYAEICSTAKYLPESIVHNRDLGQFPRKSLKLIEEKTGVISRRHADEDTCTSDLAIKAGRLCLETAKIDPQSVDCVILATSSPDRLQPATATRVQEILKAGNAFAFDVNSVCAGGVVAIHTADMFVRSGQYGCILVVAAEMYSKILNPKDISTYPYFGDGAGAVLIRPTKKRKGILKSLLRSDGSGTDFINVPAGGTMLPYKKMDNPNDVYFKMSGREVYNFAIEKVPQLITDLLDATGYTTAEIKYFVCHQANINIIKEIANKINVSIDKFVITLDHYGNTAGASTLISLDVLFSSGELGEGDLILMVAFGGGLSWGANLILL